MGLFQRCRSGFCDSLLPKNLTKDPLNDGQCPKARDVGDEMAIKGVQNSLAKGILVAFNQVAKRDASDVNFKYGPGDRIIVVSPV